MSTTPSEVGAHQRFLALGERVHPQSGSFQGERKAFVVVVVVDVVVVVMVVVAIIFVVVVVFDDAVARAV